MTLPDETYSLWMRFIQNHYICVLQNFYNNVEVKQVDVSSTTGTFGILPNHVPAISVLKPGLVVVYEQDDKQNKFFGN